MAILAGEASGDLLGAQLIKALRSRYPNLEIQGIGGPAMIAAGCKSLFDIERLAVMGFIEPLFRLPDLIKLRHDLYHYFIQYQPDVFIGIDAPDFNLGLEIKLRQAGIPIVHYVSPSIWAWRSHRIKKIAKAVNLMLTLLPFEAAIYEKHHVPVRYVGHPLAEQIPLKPDKLAARRALCIDEQATYVALLPGSRRQEIRYLAENFLKAAKLAWIQKPHLRFLTSHINAERYQEFHDAYEKFTPDLPIQFFTRRSQDIMAAADVVVVASGTATLETLLHKKPMVIAYRMSPFTYQLAKILVKVPHVGLPNLLANEMIVPELIQDSATPEAISNALLDYLDHPEKIAKLEKRFTAIHQSLHVDKTDLLVNAIESVLKN